MVTQAVCDCCYLAQYGFVCDNIVYVNTQNTSFEGIGYVQIRRHCEYEFSIPLGVPVRRSV